MVFNWSLSDSKSPQVSNTLLSILVKAAVWMVSTRPLISKSSSPFTNSSEIVLRAPITVGITITFTFNSFFFSSQVKSMYLSLFTLSFNLSLFREATTFHFKMSYLLLKSQKWKEKNVKGKLLEKRWFSACYIFVFVGYHYVWSSGRN